MATKVNLKARINRHSKIIKNSLSEVHPVVAIYRNFNYYIVLALVILVLPIYPSVAVYFSPATKIDFNREVIDESSILDSFDADHASDSIMTGGYFNVQWILDDSRDREGVNEIIEYTIQSWDSFSVLADRFEVTSDSIRWANDMDSKAVLKVGQNIKIPSISGLIHTVVDGDSIDSISKKYNIDKDKIISQNNLDSKALVKWMELIIPGAKKAKPKYTPSWYSFAKSVWASGQSKYVVDDGKYPYKLVKRNRKHTFYWGNCTYFVAEYKNVTWRWHAKDWLRNAIAQGVPTGQNPWIGSIVVLHWKGYNPWYGHVAIVMDVKVDKIIVKDMNYRRLNEVTTREIPKTDRAIRWYIYVD